MSGQAQIRLSNDLEITQKQGLLSIVYCSKSSALKVVFVLVAMILSLQSGYTWRSLHRPSSNQSDGAIFEPATLQTTVHLGVKPSMT